MRGPPCCRLRAPPLTFVYYEAVAMIGEAGQVRQEERLGRDSRLLEVMLRTGTRQRVGDRGHFLGRDGGGVVLNGR